MNLKLYLDEDVPVTLAQALQQRGIDVLTTQEAGVTFSIDEQQVAFSAKNRRAILTHNKRDFVVIHKAYMQQGKDHWGIIVSDQHKVSELLRRVSKLCFSVSAEAMKNRLEFLSSWR